MTSAIASDSPGSPKLWYLKLNRLFRSLSDDDLRQWVDRITIAMDYPRHRVIYMAEEPGEHATSCEIRRASPPMTARTLASSDHLTP